jgi:hypothetical protein
MQKKQELENLVTLFTDTEVLNFKISKSLRNGSITKLAFESGAQGGQLMNEIGGLGG